MNKWQGESLPYWKMCMYQLCCSRVNVHFCFHLHSICEYILYKSCIAEQHTTPTFSSLKQQTLLMHPFFEYQESGCDFAWTWLSISQDICQLPACLEGAGVSALSSRMRLLLATFSSAPLWSLWGAHKMAFVGVSNERQRKRGKRKCGQASEKATQGSSCSLDDLISELVSSLHPYSVR